MLMVFLAALQAPAEATPISQTVEVSEAGSADAAPVQAPQKKVCRRTMDTRVGLIAKSQKVCRYVPETGVESKS